MPDEQKKQTTRLIIQGSVPVETIAEGEELYRQLKIMLKNYSEKTICSGQIMKMLEPCCGPPKGIPHAQNHPQSP